MFWKKFSLGKKYNSNNIGVFLLKAQLSFKTVAQVSYKDEYGNTKIVRFYDNSWSREVLSFSENPIDIDFKFFAHSPNLIHNEKVILSVISGDKVLINKEFVVFKNNDFTGWFQFDSDMNQSETALG